MTSLGDYSLSQNPHAKIISGNAFTDTPRGVFYYSSRYSQYGQVDSQDEPSQVHSLLMWHPTTSLNHHIPPLAPQKC
jgi:hypothetical protein